MQLAILTAVLAAIASAETSGEPVEGLAWRLLTAGVAAILAPLAALAGTQRLAISANADETSDAIDRLKATIIAVWFCGVTLILLVAQWPQIVRGNWQLAEWPLIDELAILAPIVMSLLLMWAAFYRLERVLQLAACRVHQTAPPTARMVRYLWLEARQQLGLALLPPLVIVGLLETFSALGLRAANIDTAWWVVVPLLATALVLMPALLRQVWRTTPLRAGSLRTALDEICRERRSVVRDILVWHTDGSMGNAAVVGISCWLRYVLLTDVLIWRLSDKQIAAVVRHEVAHVRRWHLPLRLAVLLLPVAWWMAISQAWPDAASSVESTFELFGIRPQWTAIFGVPLAMILYAVAVVGWCSRRLEYDADLDACLTADGLLEPKIANDFCSALLTLCGRRRRARFSEWLHPPVVDRIDFIEGVLAEPRRGVRFRRQLVLLPITVAALYIGAIWLAFS